MLYITRYRLAASTRPGAPWIRIAAGNVAWRLAAFFLTAFFLTAFSLVSTAVGQSCYLQQDCGAGTLCSASGACEPVRSVLSGGALVWVDQARGDDDTGDGSEGRPFRSIERAMAPGALQPGDAVLIREGTYYGPIIPATGGAPGRRITIAAYPGEEVVVSGAIALEGAWTPDGDAFRLPWPFPPLWHRFEGAQDPFGPARRRDVLIADGQMLQAVYARSDLREGTFFLEGSPENPSTVFTILPGRKDPNQARMQTSRVNHLFNPSDNEPNCRFGDVKGYFHLIGLTFRHAANDGLIGTVCTGSEGSIFENLTVEWTNGTGYMITGAGHLVRGVRARYNGMSGIRGIYCDRCIVEHATSRFNNWKGYYPMWDSGGGKWLYTTRSTFRHLDFSDNEGPGLWLDMDNFDNTIEQSRFSGNRGANLFLEWTTERTLVRNNLFTGARDGGTIYYGLGVLVQAAGNNTIVHNTFLGNRGGGLRIRADRRDRARGNRYYNNLFVANHAFTDGQRSSELSFEEHQSAADARTNTGGGNVFWPRGFASYDRHTFQYRPDGADVRTSDLARWQQSAQTDYSSSVIDLARPHVSDTTDHEAGWRLADASQLIGRAVEMPDDIPPVLNDFDGEPRPASGAAVGADQPFDANAGEGNPGSSIMPVQFLTLLVLLEDNNVGIFWETTGEQDAESYEIERSADNATFTTIGTMPRSDTNAAVRSYSYSDTSLPDRSGTYYYRIKTKYRDGSVSYSGSVPLSIDGEAPPQEELTGFRIEQNFPNPAHNSTRITYHIDESAGVQLVLYDVLGREVRTLVDMGQGPGAYEVFLDTRALKSGLYYYRFTAGNVQHVRKMTVIH